MTEIENDILQAVKTGLHKAVCEKLTGYNSPLDKVLVSVIEAHNGAIRELLTEAINSALTDTDFRQQIAQGVRGKLAKQLVEKFGGEMEKQVNMLKSDPLTRARITQAIGEIIESTRKT